ncbi:LYR motif-containing protein 1 isoform X1 [Balaenoptera ricei]|nr:LYR motif-containing protein 1 isoform X1 [Balaenoptera ricei]XP_059753968.1 LYR motif-containing protein 1 isoform X1 [Balaenoptera ricei]XP_059753969.1 LYR motif-containing protein 1 isoform X1 [Balaenoptera ricei]
MLTLHCVCPPRVESLFPPVLLKSCSQIPEGPQDLQSSERFSVMTTATRQEVLGLYRRIFRLARKWQAASGQMEDTIKEKQYILNEARTLFQKNRNLTDTDLIKQCIDECTARIEIGLHYQIPYPRPIHLPPMGLTPLRGRGLRSQEKLRKFSKPVYLKSHDEVS